MRDKIPRWEVVVRRGGIPVDGRHDERRIFRRMLLFCVRIAIHDANRCLDGIDRG